MAKSCSILLIDDHAAIRETLTEVLTDAPEDSKDDEDES